MASAFYRYMFAAGIVVLNSVILKSELGGSGDVLGFIFGFVAILSGAARGWD